MNARTTAALGAMIMFAGCATTPAAFRENGLRSQAELRDDPMRAANCILRNVENAGDMWWGHATATARPGPSHDSVELVIHHVLVADIVPRGTGSVASIYAHPHMFPHLRERWLNTFKGC